LSLAHEELWSSVPTGHDHVCQENIVIAPVKHILWHSSGETKVGDLKEASIVQENIRRLQVSVNNVILVEVFEK
jgi:hypothetical protein